MQLQATMAERIAVPFSEIRNCLRRSLLLWDRPLWSALLSLAVYTIVAAHKNIFVSSQYPYQNYLADAFLHGSLHLRLVPPNTHDLSIYRSQYFLYWPPFPAILLMPFVALFGVGFSDVLFTLVVGSLNVAAVAMIIRSACARRVIRLRPLQRSLLVLTFALGTVQMTLVPFGRVWFTSQVVAFGCVALAYLAALNVIGYRAFFLVGLATAAAVLSRNHLVFTAIWPAYYLLYRHRSLPLRSLISYIAVGLMPVAFVVALLAVYNDLRFGSPFEAGIAFHQMAHQFIPTYQRYGAFNVHYIPTNFYFQYIFYPLPFREMTVMGGSLFLLTPLFIGAFWGVVTGRPRWSTLALLASIVLTALPILLLMGPGDVQFGPRYTLDFTVPLLLLTAIGIRRWPTRLVALLTDLSVVQYLCGAIFFVRYLG